MSSSAFQQSFIDDLPAGFHVYRGMVSPEQQTRLVELSRALCREAPLITPRTLYGAKFKLQITSWGDVGWYSDEQGYRYLGHHPETGRAWPPIPEEVSDVMTAAAERSGYGLDLQTVLVNFYQADAGRLGRHQDRTEKNLVSPIVTISLGDSCVFGIGGAAYTDPMQELALDSGDVVVQGGAARMYFHEVIRILPDSSKLLKQGGRISLTGRAYI
jgi:alkylated DNA repair protein (DNA oxidative demethylase)